jgi:hypothetical protein
MINFFFAKTFFKKSMSSHLHSPIVFHTQVYDADDTLWKEFISRQKQFTYIILATDTFKILQQKFPTGLYCSLCDYYWKTPLIRNIFEYDDECFKVCQHINLLAQESKRNKDVEILVNNKIIIPDMCPPLPLTHDAKECHMVKYHYEENGEHYWDYTPEPKRKAIVNVFCPNELCKLIIPVDEKPIKMLAKRELKTGEDSSKICKNPKTKQPKNPRKKIHTFDTTDGKEVELKRRKVVKYSNESDKDKAIRSYIAILKSNKVRISTLNLRNIGFGSETITEFKQRHLEEWDIAVQG